MKINIQIDSKKDSEKYQIGNVEHGTTIGDLRKRFDMILDSGFILPDGASSNNKTVLEENCTLLAYGLLSTKLLDATKNKQ